MIIVVGGYQVGYMSVVALGTAGEVVQAQSSP
jgi:hypothetical protein